MSKQKMIVISFDAMVWEDIRDTLKDYPNFRRILENGSRVEEMRTVYPSITYPVHVSLMTGATVGHHGVTGNEVEEFGNPDYLDWNWYASAVNPDVKTIFDEAKAAGLSTASVFWPVTGNSPSIDYLVTEIWEFNKRKKKIFTIDSFRKSGSRADILERICRPHEHFFYDDPDIFGPTCDNFITATARDFIRLWKPDLLMIHLGFIDYARHKGGVFSERLTQRLHYADDYLGVLMDTCREYGLLEDTNFVLLSDHGQMNIDKGVALNVRFAEDGWIRLDENGNVLDYDIFLRSTAASCQIYLKDRNDRDLEVRAFEYLKSLQKEGIYGIERIYTAEEARAEEDLYGNFSFVIEGDGHTGFSGKWTGPAIMHPSDEDYHFATATHGYHPDKGPKPPFLCAGPAFRKGVVLKKGSVLDAAPTIAKAMGFAMTTADGKPMDELLK